MTSSESLSQRARDLHFSSLVVDTHSDTIMRMTDDGDDLATATGKGHLDLPRIKAGNLGRTVVVVLRGGEQNPDQEHHRQVP